MTVYSGQVEDQTIGQGGLDVLGGDAQELVTYQNRVWDTQETGSDKSHYWVTNAEPDVNGDYYDGPGTWGVHTSDFCAFEL